LAEAGVRCNRFFGGFDEATLLAIHTPK